MQNLYINAYLLFGLASLAKTMPAIQACNTHFDPQEDVNVRPDRDVIFPSHDYLGNLTRMFFT